MEERSDSAGSELSLSSSAPPAQPKAQPTPPNPSGAAEHRPGPLPWGGGEGGSEGGQPRRPPPLAPLGRSARGVASASRRQRRPVPAAGLGGGGAMAEPSAGLRCGRPLLLLLACLFAPVLGKPGAGPAVRASQAGKALGGGAARPRGRSPALGWGGSAAVTPRCGGARGGALSLGVEERPPDGPLRARHGLRGARQRARAGNEAWRSKIDVPSRNYWSRNISKCFMGALLRLLPERMIIRESQYTSGREINGR